MRDVALAHSRNGPATTLLVSLFVFASTQQRDCYATEVCQHGKFQKTRDFGALSPDILSHEAYGGAWEFALLKHPR